MRIGVIGPLSPDSFAENILMTLHAMGYEVVSLGTAMPRPRSRLGRAVWTPAGRIDEAAEMFQRALIRKASRFKPDVIVNVEAELRPHTVTALRDLGAVIGLWFPDPVTALTRQTALAAPYSAFFFKDPLLAQRIRDTTGLRSFYLPEACNPAWHFPTDRDDIEPHVILVGNVYPSRALLLDRLYRARIPLRIHSSGFPRWLKGLEVQSLPVHAPVFRHEKAVAFRRAAAVLNNLSPFEMTSVNCRLFEAAGSGAVILSEDRPAIDDLFKREVEVMTFRTADELIDRCRDVLASPHDYTGMGDAASERALDAHSYSQRLNTMLGLLAHSE